MIPCIGVTIRDNTYYPLFNNRAYFRLQDDFPEDVIDTISDDTSRTGFKLALEVFSMLCEEGNAVRKRYGYEPGAVLNMEDAEYDLMPMDIVKLKNAIYATIAAGYGQELSKDETEETDVWLVELEKKTK